MNRPAALAVFVALAVSFPAAAQQIDLATLAQVYEESKAELMKPVTDFHALYAGNLEKLLAEATAAGDLELVLAVKTELEGFRSGETPPAEERHARLKQMQDVYRQTLPQRLAQADQALAPLAASYRAKLEELQVALTRQEKIAEALQVKAALEALEAGDAPPATLAGGGAKTAPSGRVELDIPDRRWPRQAYDPGKPGKLGGFGVVWPGDRPLDLSRAEGIDDFVKVVVHNNGWIALRANGQIASTDDGLHGRADATRLVAVPDDGALVFWADDSITFNGEKNPLRYADGTLVSAASVDSISRSWGGILVILKDGSVRLIGPQFTPEERTQIESAFAGVRVQGSYRYGVWGAKPDGGLVVALTADSGRIKQQGAVRLPSIDDQTRGRGAIVAFAIATDAPLALSAKGEVFRVGGGWFPQRAEFQPVNASGGLWDARGLKNVVELWHGNKVYVTLVASGRWFVHNDFKSDDGQFGNELDAALQARRVPLKALDLRAHSDQGKHCAFAIWIE
jgi:hypothetical protein